MLDLSMFIKVTSYEDCTVDVDLLVWDGCDCSTDHVTVDGDTGFHYPQNDFIAYIELPSQDEAQEILGEG